jgi:hypothetical protein
MIDTFLTGSGEVEIVPTRPKVVGRRLKPNVTGLVGHERWWVDHPYKLEKATEWLLARLANGTRPCAEILAAAKASNIVYRTLRRAKKAAKINSERIPRGRLGKWFWHPPEQENIDGRQS